MRQSRATPRSEGCRVGGCTCFFDKDKAKFLQNVWKNQFQTFSIRCFSIFIFFYLKILFSIPGEGKIFRLISDKDGGWKNVCKSGVPRMGMGDTSPPPR